MNTRFAKSLRSRKRPLRKGAALVECALVTPLLILLVLGAIDVGQLLNVAQTVNNASREGARRASRNTVTSASEIEEAVETYLANSFPNLTPEELDAALSVNVRNEGGTLIEGDLTTFDSGDSISVEVIFQYDAVRWTAGFAGASDQSLQITTTMRRE